MYVSMQVDDRLVALQQLSSDKSAVEHLRVWRNARSLLWQQIVMADHDAVTHVGLLEQFL